MATELTMAGIEEAGERDLGTSSWVKIEQRQIDLFAEATGDHQWIHVDPAAAGCTQAISATSTMTATSSLSTG